MTDAQAKFDSATLDKIYASDFIEVSPVGDVDARDKTIGFYKPELNPKQPQIKTAVTTDNFSIRSYGKFAVVIARIVFAQAQNDAASQTPVSFTATIVCRKEKGAWKISSAQYTRIRLPTPPSVK